MESDDHHDNDAAAGEKTRILCVGGHFFPWSRVKNYRRVKRGGGK
jgi:hypothetical protein